jgi:DnaJ-class molecular chaperone
MFQLFRLLVIFALGAFLIKKLSVVIFGKNLSGTGAGSPNREQSSRASNDLKDPYKVLGLSKLASQAEIKTAYRDQISRYHPDKVGHLGPELQELAEKKTQQINWAYQQLRH